MIKVDLDRIECDSDYSIMIDRNLLKKQKIKMHYYLRKLKSIFCIKIKVIDKRGISIKEGDKVLLEYNSNVVDRL